MQKSKKLLSALMALVMVLTSFPIMAFATDNANKIPPADGTVSGAPFVSGSPSSNYRIPGIVTLKDGSLVAVADARWNAYADGGGNDVIVSRSTDNGATWRYHMLNYFGDNGDWFNKGSTSFCDSAIATDGQNVYVLSTFFPAGYAINSSSGNNRPVAENAFDNAGRLKLRLNGSSTWDFYLDTNTKNDKGNYVIRRYSNNSIVTDYSVDTNYYLRLNSNNGQNGSIFYEDGVYQTVKTTFLWFRSSNDGGITWNPARLVNVKLDSEMFLGVGPGRGVVTSNGDIVFATYRWNRHTTLGIESNDKQVNFQRTYLISSTDGGYTWSRTSADATNDAWWSSEAVPIELPNGDIRVFLRSGGKRIVYSDAYRTANGTYAWRNNAQKIYPSFDNGLGVDNWSDCQESAITYPYKINGKNAIMVACPISNQGRKNGNIHVFLLNDDNSVSSMFRYNVTDQNTGFDYSSMTVLQNGNIALLYETGGKIEFKEYPISTLVPAATVDKPESESITLAPGETKTVSIPGNYNISNSSDSIATATKVPVAEAKCRPGVNADSSWNYSSGSNVPLSNALYTFTRQSNGTWIIASRPFGSNNTQTKLFLNRVWGIPQYANDSQNIEILSSNLGDGMVYFKGGGMYLAFGRMLNSNGASQDRKFNQLDISEVESSSQSTHDGNGSTPREAASFWLYRKANPTETSSAEIPGFVKVNGVSNIEDGKEYLIVSRYKTSAYFCLYPSTDYTNSNNNRTHSAQIMPNDTTVQSYNLTFTGVSEGTTKIKVGDNIEYNVTVAKMDNVTGAVQYDPVIYTQGTSVTEFGNNIAQGKVDGEYKTSYKLAPNWSIDHIEITNPESKFRFTTDSPSTVTSSNVTVSSKTSNGILGGTVNIANNTADAKTDWVKVLVKTYLVGPDGKTYIQKNHLYVTTSPVPAHGVAGTQCWYGAGPSVVTLSGFSLTAMGSTSSYALNPYHSPQAQGANNSGDSYSNISDRGMGNAAYIANAGQLIFSRDNANTAEFYTRTGSKLGGYTSYYGSGGGLGAKRIKTVNYAPEGYYYYDTSSSSNYGFANGTTSNSFKIQMALNIANQNDTIGTLNSYIVDDSYMTVGSNTTSTGNWQNWTSMGYIKTFDYSSQTNCHQAISLPAISSSNASNGIISASYTVALLQCRDRNTEARTEIQVPFKIQVDSSKTEIRNVYNKVLSNGQSGNMDVLISSDYTTSSWTNYEEAILNAEGYLNNYKYGQTYPSSKGGMLQTNYGNLQRVADFSELDEILRSKKNLRDSEFPFGSSGYSIYTQSSWSQFQTYYDQGNNCANVEHAVVNPTSTPRPDYPGYTVGAHSTTKNQNQIAIDNHVKNISAYPVYAADPTNFEAAKALSKTLDLDAYNLVEPIGTEISSGDSEIYFEGKPESKIVDISATEQSIIDNHTAALLNTMNVATDGNTDPDNNKGKVCNVTVHKYNGDVKEPKFSQCYAYDTQLMIDLAPYIDDSETATIVITNDNSTTTIPLTDDKVIPVLAASGNVDITITTTQKPAVVVYDYYGTILYSGFVNAKSDIVCDDAAKTVTIGGTVVDAKPSPSINFDHWLIVDEDGVFKVLQRGIRVGSDYSIVVAKGLDETGNEVAIGTVTHFGETEPTETFSGLGRQYTVKAADGITPLVWKMSVYNENQPAHEYLAAYGSTFSRFTSNYNVIYTPLTDEDQVKAFGDAYGKPISYGDGYMSGDDKNGNEIPDKFTLGCSFSAPEEKGITIREAGVLYSTNGDLNAETMLKGAEGVSAKKQNKVSEYGTYTMTKTDADAGTHLMRSYVTYTTEELGATIIRVSYGPVYKCVNGQVSIVD